MGKGKRPGGPGKGGAPSQRSDAFERKTFRTSRLADFASIPELIKQTGQPPEHWPLVILKELADNGVDDAEEGGTAPEIEIAVTDNSIKARSKTGWPPSAKFPANAGENAAGKSEQRFGAAIHPRRASFSAASRMKTTTEDDDG
jgi:hypothetical protein